MMASKSGGKIPTSPRASTKTAAASTPGAIESPISNDHHSSEEQAGGLAEVSDTELQSAERPTLEPPSPTASDTEDDDDDKESELHTFVYKERVIHKKTLPPVVTTEAEEIEAPDSDDSSEPLPNSVKDNPDQQPTEEQPVGQDLQEKPINIPRQAEVVTRPPKKDEPSPKKDEPSPKKDEQPPKTDKPPPKKDEPSPKRNEQPPKKDKPPPKKDEPSPKRNEQPPTKAEPPPPQDPDTSIELEHLPAPRVSFAPEETEREITPDDAGDYDLLLPLDPPDRIMTESKVRIGNAVNVGIPREMIRVAQIVYRSKSMEQPKPPPSPPSSDEPKIFVLRKPKSISTKLVPLIQKKDAAPSMEQEISLIKATSIPMNIRGETNSKLPERQVSRLQAPKVFSKSGEKKKTPSTIPIEKFAANPTAVSERPTTTTSPGLEATINRADTSAPPTKLMETRSKSPIGIEPKRVSRLPMKQMDSGTKEQQPISQARAASVGPLFRSVNAEAQGIDQMSSMLISKVKRSDLIDTIPINKMAATSHLPKEMESPGRKDESIVRARAASVGPSIRSAIAVARHVERISPTTISKEKIIDSLAPAPIEKAAANPAVVSKRATTGSSGLEANINRANAIGTPTKLEEMRAMSPINIETKRTSLLPMEQRDSGTQETSISPARAATVGPSFRSVAEARHVERVSTTAISNVKSNNLIGSTPIEETTAPNPQAKQVDSSGRKEDSIAEARVVLVGPSLRQGPASRPIEQIAPTATSKIKTIDAVTTTPIEGMAAPSRLPQQASPKGFDQGKPKSVLVKLASSIQKDVPPSSGENIDSIKATMIPTKMFDATDRKLGIERQLARLETSTVVPKFVKKIAPSMIPIGKMVASPAAMSKRPPATDSPGSEENIHRFNATASPTKFEEKRPKSPLGIATKLANLLPMKQMDSRSKEQPISRARTASAVPSVRFVAAEDRRVERIASTSISEIKSADLIDSSPIDEMAALLAMQVDSSGRKEEESVARVRAASVGQSFRSGAEARRITDVERISPTLISQVESIESIAPTPAPIEKMAAASRLPLRMDLSGSKDESIIRARAETVGQVFRQGRDARHIERIITPISKIESVDIGGSTPSEKKQEIIGPEAKSEVVQPETSEEESDAFEIDVSGTLDISIDLAAVGQIQQADISINTEIEADLVSEMEEVSVAGNVNCVMTGIEDPASERGYDKTVPSIASSPVSMSFDPRSRTRSESPANSRRRPSSSPPASISNANIINNPVSNRRSSSVPPEQGASGGGRAVINSPTSHRGQLSTSPATSSGRIFDTMGPSSSKSVPIESNTPAFKGWEPPRGPGMRDFIGKMMSPTRSVPVEMIDVKAPSPLPEFVYVNSFGEIIVAAEDGKQKPTRSSQGTSSEKS